MPSNKRSKNRPAKRQPGSSGNSRKMLLRFLLLAGIWCAVILGAYIAYCALDLPDVHQISQQKKRPSVTMETEDGTVFAHYGDLYGDRVTLSNVPRYVPQAIIAIEDRRFYSHFGVDVFGLLRAAVRDAVARHVVQGGSTLTQQLAKNLFLTPDRTLKRKVQEMMLALWLEHTYSKDQILEAYLNRVYLGSGAYGVDAAAHTYFGKSAGDLNIREAAIIAGLLRAPSRYAPTHDPVAALERAKVVMQAMVEEHYITDAQRNAAIAGANAPKSKPGPAGDGHYFADWVNDQLEPFEQDTAQDLIVKTTLNLNLERMAERHLDDILAKQNGHDVSQGALVTLAADGAIKAMVGGRNYAESQFNRATQALRQPGSSFKPIVYLAAIEEGLSPDDVIEDAPITLGHWSPENFENKYRGPVTAREALADSINTVAVRVFQRVGATKVIQTARALGITSPLEHDPALALGASEVTVLEMTGVYASLAAGGRAVTPYAIEQITDRQGHVLFRHTAANPPAAVSASAVETLTGMMEEVVRSGTGKKAALGDRPVAGKTGTSSDYRDAWFLGFTGDYTTGVWLGNDDNHPMRKIVGGSLPAQLWHDYMTEAEAGLPVTGLNAGNHSSGGWFGGGGGSKPSGEDTGSDTISSLGNFIDSLLSGGGDKQKKEAPANEDSDYPPERER